MENNRYFGNYMTFAQLYSYLIHIHVCTAKPLLKQVYYIKFKKNAF